MTDVSSGTAVVIKLPAVALLAVAMFAFALLALVNASNWFLLLMLIPLALAVVVLRLRTVADRTDVTARALLSSRTVPWQDIKGLRFDKGNWARAELTDGSTLRLPAVTFGTLPLLTAASGGRVPNPYND